MSRGPESRTQEIQTMVASLPDDITIIPVVNKISNPDQKGGITAVPLLYFTLRLNGIEPEGIAEILGQDVKTVSSGLIAAMQCIAILDDTTASLMFGKKFKSYKNELLAHLLNQGYFENIAAEE